MTALDNLVSKHDELGWTPDEIADWISGLPEDKRIIFLDGLKEAKQNGMNVHRFACKARKSVELIDKKSKANGMSVVDFLSSASIGWALGGIIGGTKKL